MATLFHTVSRQSAAEVMILGSSGASTGRASGFSLRAKNSLNVWLRAKLVRKSHNRLLGCEAYFVCFDIWLKQLRNTNLVCFNERLYMRLDDFRILAVIYRALCKTKLSQIVFVFAGCSRLKDWSLRSLSTRFSPRRVCCTRESAPGAAR